MPSIFVCRRSELGHLDLIAEQDSGILGRDNERLPCSPGRFLAAHDGKARFDCRETPGACWFRPVAQQHLSCVRHRNHDPVAVYPARLDDNWLPEMSCTHDAPRESRPAASRPSTPPIAQPRICSRRKIFFLWNSFWRRRKASRPEEREVGKFVPQRPSAPAHPGVGTKGFSTC